MDSIHCINVLLAMLTTLLIGHLYAQLPIEIEEKFENEQQDILNYAFENSMGEIDVSESQNVEDFDNFSKIVYSSCSLTYPITNDMIANAKNGIISEDRNFKCYLMCAFQKLELIYPDKNSTDIDEYSLMTLFEDRFDGTIDIIIKKCLPVRGIKDSCEIVYQYVKCSLRIDKRSVAFIPVSSRVDTNKKKS